MFSSDHSPILLTKMPLNFFFFWRFEIVTPSVPKCRWTNETHKLFQYLVHYVAQSNKWCSMLFCFTVKQWCYCKVIVHSTQWSSFWFKRSIHLIRCCKARGTGGLMGNFGFHATRWLRSYATSNCWYVLKRCETGCLCMDDLLNPISS